MLESWYQKLKYNIFRDILIYELYINRNNTAQQQWRLAEIHIGRMMPTKKE
ncbi:14526_t:CDS:1, partial [Dentiscutata heterogama]